MAHKCRNSSYISGLYNWIHGDVILLNGEHWTYISFRKKNIEFSFENDNLEMLLSEYVSITKWIFQTVYLFTGITDLSS